VGGHVHRFAVGQRPDLSATASASRVRKLDDTGATNPAFRIVVLTLLAVDGAISAIVGALLLPTYIGTIPFPVSALISGLLNAVLVWAAGRWTVSARVAALPFWTWLLTVLLMCVPGPGGDVIFGGRGVLAYSPLLLLVMGVVPPFLVLYRRQPTR
jgi:hypothetical protein